MDSDEVWRTIDEQRSDVADLLDELSEQEWSTPSLCAAWTVRQVAAHLTLAHMRLLPCLVAIGRARGSIDRMIRDTAIRQARLPVRDYAPRLRAMIGSRRTVPFVTELEPLLDILVHAQDITQPLGRVWPMPVDAAMTAADLAATYPADATRITAGGTTTSPEGPSGSLKTVPKRPSSSTSDVGDLDQRQQADRHCHTAE